MQKPWRFPLAPLKAVIPILALIGAALLMSGLSERRLQDEARRNLVSLLDVIASGIETESRRAIVDADFAAAQPALVVALQALLTEPRRPEALLAADSQTAMRHILAPLLAHELYPGFLIIAPDDIVVAADRNELVGQPSPLVRQRRVLERARAGESQVSLPQPAQVPLNHSSGGGEARPPTAFAVAPVRDPAGAVIAVIALRLDLDNSLFRTLNAGTAGDSGESYVFDRNGLLLSESRFTTGLWESGRLPRGEESFANLTLNDPTTGNLTRMAAAAIAGEHGIDIDGYPDYRGIKVIGAWRWLPDNDLGVAVEIDAAEVFGGTRLLQGTLFAITMLAGSLILFVSGLTSSQNRRLEHMVTERTAEMDRGHAKLRALFSHAPDGLISADASGVITAFSVRAAAMFGYSESQAIGKPIQALFTADLPQLHSSDRTVRLEIEGRRKDGATVPLDLSLNWINSDGHAMYLAIVRDLSETKRLQGIMHEEIRRREEAEERQRLLLESAGEGIFWLDTDRRISFINPAGEALLGYESGQLLGRRLTDPEGDHLPICAADCPLATNDIETRYSGEATAQRGDGLLLEMEFTRTPLQTEGESRGSVVIFSDISVRKRAEQSMLLAENVFQHINEGVVVADERGRILRANRAQCAMVGYSENELIGHRRPPYHSGEHPPAFYEQLWNGLLKKGVWEGEIWNRRKDGELFPTWQTIIAIRNGGQLPEQFVSVTRDITEQRRSEQRIHRLAYFDNLTGLPNRELFFDRFSHAIERAKRQNNGIALLFLDLDRFKNVNDSLGHPVGDALLAAVAERLRKLVRGEDTIARLGGDEFTLLLESTSEDAQIANVAQKVIDAICSPFEVGKHTLHIGTSVGISVFPRDGEDATTLVKHADAAMYQAKSAGRNGYKFYAVSMTASTNEQLVMESHLHSAVKNREFVLHYQPQLTADGSVIGVEALIRWQCPGKGLLPPERFLRVAEQSGLIGVIGEWALRTACEQMREWRANGAPTMRLAVNLSSSQITHGNILHLVSSVLRDTGLPAELLELEVAETLVTDNAEDAVAALASLRKLGVRIAIDDFGSGRSSLVSLKRMPADTLKIDRAFVRDIPNDMHDVAIARAILAMAKHLQLDTVAEGVETTAQEAFLKAAGCDIFQGYLFSEPLPAAEIEGIWQQEARSSLTS